MNGRSVYLEGKADWDSLAWDLRLSDSPVGLDTEVIGIDPRDDSAVLFGRVVAWSIGIPDGPLHPRGFRRARGFVLPPKALDNVHLRGWLEGDYPKVLHNARFDLHMLAREGVRLGGRIYDTIDIYRVVSPGREHYGLKYLAPDILGGPLRPSFKETFSAPVVRETVKTVTYRVCCSHGRPENTRLRNCPVCKERMVEMTEEVRESRTLKTKRRVPLQEVCGVTITTSGWLEVSPGEHELWPTFVDYAGQDAIDAAELFMAAEHQRLATWTARVPEAA